MLTVTLYEFRKRENSTKRPDASSTQRDHQAVLKMPTSLLRPEITFDFGLKGNPTFYNYAYISDLGNRYYFIRDWTVSEGHLWTAHMEVDVLASWKASIGASTQYVKRSSYTFDGGILDPIYPTKQPPNITVTEDTSPWTTALASGTYVLGIVNNASGGMGAAHYYAFNQKQMSALLEYLLGDVSLYAGDITDISEQLVKILFNPLQYIVSCVWYPFEISVLADGSVTPLSKTPIGWWELDVSCNQLNRTIKYFTSTLDVPRHPQATTRGIYLNKQPFTTYTLYYPGIGQMVLDPSLIVTDSLSINCAVDMIANQARIRIDAGTGIVTVQYGQIGVPIQLAQMASKDLNVLKTMGSGLIKAAVGGAVAGPAGLAGGMFDLIGSAVENAYPQTTLLSANGSLASLYYTVQLRTVCYLLVDEDNADLGRPLCKTRKLSDVPGYQMIMHADIAIPGTKEENQMIKNYMESGYFYE